MEHGHGFGRSNCRSWPRRQASCSTSVTISSSSTNSAICRSASLAASCCCKLYENTSLLITTNLAFADWPQGSYCSPFSISAALALNCVVRDACSTNPISCHCCPVKRGLFCKLGLLHKGFWSVYFGGTLSAVWASGDNFLPDFIFESGRYHVRRPDPLFTGHGFCSVDKFRSHCPEVWWRRARPNASLHGTFPRYGICASNVSRESARHRSLSWSAAVKIVQHGVARADCKINIG